MAEKVTPPTDEEKALAILRLEAMKGDLRRARVNDKLLWRLTVRDPESGQAHVHDNEGLLMAVAFGHTKWAPAFRKHRKSVAQRAAKFNVAELAPEDTEFWGINEVPPVAVTVLAHLYDNLVQLEGDEPELVYNRIAPAEWNFQSHSSPLIKGSNLRKICHRIDAHLHQYFVQKREEIRSAAREAGLLDTEIDEPEESEEIQQDLPPVVMPEPETRPDPRSKQKPTRGWWLFVGAVLIFGWGTMFGVLIGKMLG